MRLPNDLANLLDYARSEAKRACHGTVAPVHIARALLRTDGDQFAADFSEDAGAVVEQALQAIERTTVRITDGEETLALLERVAAAGGSREALIDELRKALPGLVIAEAGKPAVPIEDSVKAGTPDATETTETDEGQRIERAEPVIAAPIQERVVRVFISSTFLDMHAEREELVKYTFPELRRRCRERGVEFVDVDLRWGVTQEQSERGEVLPVCLAEIERCHPWFIGFLGERYGWVPEWIDDELIDTQPWLEEHRNRSVTELEILHGVLENPKMDKRSFFYFRDKKISQQIEAVLAKEADYRAEPEASSNKLNSLKKKITESGYPNANFTDVKALGQQVLEDLWAAIDKQFPENEIPSPLERTRLEHEAFAAVRRKVYIGRQEYFDRLDAHVSNDDPPLVLLGESGSGKSALIANWVEQYRQQHPDDFVLLHFLGSTPDSTDYVQLLRRIILEIKAYTEPGQMTTKDTSDNVIAFKQDDKEDIPTDPQKLIEAFPLWLAKAAAKGKFILILDGVNQLEDRDTALDLTWLPRYIPPAIRLIVSTLPGRSLEALQKRNWPSMNIELLDNKQGTEERSTLITDYLSRFSKSLDDGQVERITSAEQTTNPLYLKTLLDELRVFGSHKKLNERIEYYLQANTVNALFDKMLERLEQDYECDHPGLTKDVISLIWVSRHGLSETELLDILNVPQAVWSPLKLAMEESLVIRSGLFNFFHDFLRQAVQKRYLNESEEQKAAHLRIADYFEEKELYERKLDELPWQLMEAEEWSRLKDCVVDLDIFSRLMADDRRYELTSYWLAIGERYDMVVSYNGAIERYEHEASSERELSYRLNAVAFFLNLNARYDGAESLYRRALELKEKVYGSVDAETAESLNNLAHVLNATGDYDSAEPLFRKALSIWEKVFGSVHPYTALCLNNLAELLRNKGDYDGAEPLFRRALAIREKVLGPEHPYTGRCLNNLAELLRNKGDYEGAEPLVRRTLAIWEKVLGPKHSDTALCLNNLAELLRNKGDYDAAEPFLRRAMSISEEVLGPEHPRTAAFLNNLALLLEDKGDCDGADLINRRALAIREKVLGPEHPDTALSLNNLAALLYKKDEDASAEPLFRRALAIRNTVLGPEHPDTVLSMDNLAELLDKKGDYDGVELLYRRVLAIREKSLGPEHPDTAASLNNLASVLRDKGDYDAAEPLYRRALDIREKTLGSEHMDTAMTLIGLAGPLGFKGDVEGARKYLRQGVEILKIHFGPDHPEVTKFNSILDILEGKV